MISFITYMLAIATCAYVVAPLFKRELAPLRLSNEKNDRIQELLHQKKLLSDTIQDLVFDAQTGKLSEDDLQELVDEQQKMLNKVEQQIQSLTGSNQDDVRRSLEKEIRQARQVLKPELKCPSCGRKVGEEDKFCANCGTALK